MWQLLDHVPDPVARSSFRNVFGYALAAAGQCDEAIRITMEQMEDAERCRLDFVIPYALTNRAIVATLQRDYLDAEALLEEAEARARVAGDQTARFISWAVKTRLLNAQGAFDIATTHPVPRDPGVTSSLEGELMACYALAYAGSGELDRAVSHAERALSSSIAAEIVITAPCALAVAASKTRNTSAAQSHARLALDATTKSGLIESFVSAYRGCPELIVSLLADVGTHERTRANSCRGGRCVDCTTQHELRLPLRDEPLEAREGGPRTHRRTDCLTPKSANACSSAP